MLVPQLLLFASLLASAAAAAVAGKGCSIYSRECDSPIDTAQVKAYCSSVFTSTLRISTSTVYPSVVTIPATQCEITSSNTATPTTSYSKPECLNKHTHQSDYISTACSCLAGITYTFSTSTVTATTALTLTGPFMVQANKGYGPPHGQYFQSTESGDGVTNVQFTDDPQSDISRSEFFLDQHNLFYGFSPADTAYEVVNVTDGAVPEYDGYPAATPKGQRDSHSVTCAVNSTCAMTCGIGDILADTNLTSYGTTAGGVGTNFWYLGKVGNVYTVEITPYVRLHKHR